MGGTTRGGGGVKGFARMESIIAGWIGRRGDPLKPVRAGAYYAKTCQKQLKIAYLPPDSGGSIHSKRLPNRPDPARNPQNLQNLQVNALPVSPLPYFLELILVVSSKRSRATRKKGDLMPHQDHCQWAEHYQ
jgi:hypothetical protein